MDQVQRQILWNQLEILKKLDPERLVNYELQQETLYNGYTEYYSDVFHASHLEEASVEMQNETIEILNMFRALSIAKNQGWIPKNTEKSVFQGFDGNHDDHYGFANYLLDRRGLFSESAKCERNSHSEATLKMYRRMLEDWRNCKNKWELTNEEAELITT